MGAPVAAINLSAGTERQWQGTLRPRVAKGSNPRAEAQISQWDDEAGWDHDQDEAAGHRARRLLSRSNSGFHRLSDNFAAMNRWVTGERWVKRLAVVIAVLAVIFAGCFGGLWWRLGAGPINLDMATPWLAAAIEDNIGHGNTVEVGGTQIERAGRIRIAVRIRDIVVTGPRPCHRRQRPEGRGEIVRHRAPDGAAARREPQSGGCRTGGANHAGWPGHGFRRRHRQTARDRRCLEARRGPGGDIPAPARAGARAGATAARNHARTDCWPASTGSTA